MNIKYFISVLIFTIILFTFSLSKASDYSTEIKSFAEDSKKAVDAVMVVVGYEWGPGVPKIIVEFNDVVSGFDKNTFLVKSGGSDRSIIDAYNTDADGIKQNNATNYITFEFKVKNGEASPFKYDFQTSYNDWADPYEFKLSLHVWQRLSARWKGRAG